MTVRIALLAILLGLPTAPAQDLRAEFLQPPAAARPWVYWFWLNGNVTREGITADLEAMARVGIGGVLIMEVDQGAPDGPVAFASPEWRELFAFAVSEAARLGLEVNMNNDAGWCGSGGPWVLPEQAMQQLCWSETKVHGPGRVEVMLPQPPTVGGFYRDIAVLAYPQPEDDAYRIAGIEAKACFTIGHVPVHSESAAAPAAAVIPHQRVEGYLGPRMAPDGRFVWTVPAGDWIVMRLGHTLTGAVNAPAPAAGRGLESDKLSREATRAYFAGLMEKLCQDVGPLAGRTLVATHIDSWETGSQNWTPRFREEFKRRRGYDPLTWFPVVAGRVLDSLEASERFLWDLRKTVSELILDHYAAEMRELAQRHGLRLSIEAYGEPADDLAYAGRADEPMAEFWSYSPYAGASTATVMASAAHVYGKRILGAEAFTASDAERWQAHPGALKIMGDWAFCEGINRFVFHRYAMQPWLDRAPGMSMGPWGLHYERTNTWWDELGAYHTYLSRCQHLLRQGLYVADVLYVAPEAAPAHFVPQVARASALDRPGYNFDACPAEIVFDRLSVADGRLMLPDGMSYRVLVLPPGRVMTAALLERVRELLRAGATVVGDRPIRSPSLADYPSGDARLRALADELWGEPENGETERRVGLGRLVWGRTAEQVLAADGLPPDFQQTWPTGEDYLRWIHRRDGDTDLYFVANKLDQAVDAVAAFRVTGKQPELWWPASGRITEPAAWRPEAGVTRVPLRLGPAESVFVVFRRPLGRVDPVVSLRHGEVELTTTPTAPASLTIENAIYGPADDPARTIDVTDKVRALTDAGVRSFRVATMAADHDPAYGVVKTLRVEYTIGGVRRVALATDPEDIQLDGPPLDVVVRRATYGPEGDEARTIDVTEKVRRLAAAGRRSFPVVKMAEDFDPAVLVVKTLRVEYVADGEERVESRRDGEAFRFRTASESTRVRAMTRGADGRVTVEVEEPGVYELTTAAGRTWRLAAGGWPGPLTVRGPWSVQFAEGRGAPERIELPELISWSRHEDPGVRYYSGPGTYRASFELPASFRAPDRRLYLDLGRVEVIATVSLNDQELGTLWAAPYEVEVTDVARVGSNTLTVRVVNQWINRMIGDEELEEDSPRHPNGTCVAWPDWLYAGRPSPTGRYTFTSWRLWRRGEPLVDSGLLGPVRLYATRLLTPRAP